MHHVWAIDNHPQKRDRFENKDGQHLVSSQVQIREWNIVRLRKGWRQRVINPGSRRR
jgi:hypothetical protein